MFNKLWSKTKEVAATYTGTFIVVMILNQLLFFGFCLNPICLTAAMPHVLLITIVLGTFINKVTNWGEKPLQVGKKIDRAAETVADIAEFAEEESRRIAKESKARKGDRLREPATPLTEASKKKISCPKCGAAMQRKLARKGKHAGNEFFGCSQYPNCKGIVNIPQTKS